MTSLTTIFSASPSCFYGRIATATFITSLFLVGACSPEFNWRQVQSEQAHYQLLLPDKPAQASKTIQLARHKLAMQMQGSQAGGIQFVIAHVACSQQDQAEILVAMRQGLIQNLQASPSQVSQTADGLWQIHSDQPKPQFMWAKFFASADNCYQMLMLSSTKAIPEDARDTFFGSFKSLH